MTLFFIILSVIIGLIYGILMSHPGLLDEQYLFYISRFFFICISIVGVRTITYLIVEKSLGAKKQIPSDLLQFMISGVLYVLCGALIMKYGFDMNLAALITTSALLTAVVGFALQATLGNVFGGLSLQVEQQFYIGDTVRIKDVIGTIEAITWRSVSIKTLESSTIIIPNNKISSGNVEVFPEKEPIFIKVKIPAPIANPPQQVRKIVNEVISNVPYVVKNKPVIINMGSIDTDDKVNFYTIICFCENFLLSFAAKSVIKERIWYAFLRNKIDLLNIEKGHSMPIQSYFFEKDEAKSNLKSADYLRIISNTTILEPLNTEEKQYIADNMEKLMFTHGEPVIFENELHNAMFIIAYGKVKAEHKNKSIAKSALINDVDEIEEVNKRLWEPAILNNISEQLISFIGPIGKYLVDQASSRTLDPYKLYHILAADIDDPENKDRFLKNAPECPVKKLNAQDFFGELKLLGVKQELAIDYEAIGHVEIIAITSTIFKDILERRPSLSEDFSKIIAKGLEEGSELDFDFEGDSAEKDIQNRIMTFYDLSSEQNSEQSKPSEPS